MKSGISLWTVIVMAALLGSATLAFSEEKLGLDQYLEQVRTQHTGVQGALETRQGAFMHSNDARLLIRPTLVGNLQLSRDDSDNFQYGTDKLIVNTYSLAIRQDTTWGMDAKLGYDLAYYSFTPLNPTSPINGSFNRGSPSIQITQALWRNGFGSETRANLDVSNASALATSLNESYVARVTLSQAEQAYWNLALARESVRIAREVLDNAQKLSDWNESRAKLQLVDRSDVLQANALLRLRTLELKTAQDAERIASRTFNSFRGVDSDEVATQIDRLSSDRPIEPNPPARAAVREDVRAAQEQERASYAQSQLGRERATPQFDVFASYTLNGINQNLNTAFSTSFRMNQPSAAVGVRLAIPLDPGLISESRKGYALEQQAAEKILGRRFFDQENEWNDLTRRLEEAKTRLDLAIQVEKVQADKLKTERDRLKRGRTTTFQVVQFEQDYAQAKLSTIRVQAEILTLIAQMKNFGGPV